MKSRRVRKIDFIDFNEIELTKQQQEYVDTYIRMFNAPIYDEDKAYLLDLPIEVQQEVIHRHRRILSGYEYRHAQSVYFKNYETALKNNGEYELALFLHNLVNKVKKQKDRQGLISQLTNLDLYYGRTKEARDHIHADTISDSIAQAARDLINYALDEKINVIDTGMPVNVIANLMDTGYITEYDVERIWKQETLANKNGSRAKNIKELEDIIGSID